MFASLVQLPAHGSAAFIVPSTGAALFLLTYRAGNLIFEYYVTTLLKKTTYFHNFLGEPKIIQATFE
jgi:hypothetical protein